MREEKLGLLKKAIEAHEKIFPCGEASLLEDCFTETGEKLFFWFNTEDDSTHIVEHTVKQEE